MAASSSRRRISLPAIGWTAGRGALIKGQQVVVPVAVSVRPEVCRPARGTDHAHVRPLSVIARVIHEEVQVQAALGARSLQSPLFRRSCRAQR
jgi:hypothetical protein